MSTNGNAPSLFLSNGKLFPRVGNSLFGSTLFRSKSLILNSDRDQFALVALYKRATVSESLSLLFNMSDREQIALVALYKRATMSESLSTSLKKSDVSDWLLI